jgi:hypothetical protein
MKQKSALALMLPIVTACIAFGFIRYAADVHKEIKRQNEKEVRAKIENAFGKLYISKGESDRILVADIRLDSDKESNAEFRYSVDGGVGRLNINMGKENHTGDNHESKVKAKRTINFGNIEESTWNLGFSGAIPISFDIELGAGKGDFDMSGLMVKDFEISTGASKVTLAFNEPNLVVMDRMKIETGLSKFVGKKLGNANFRMFQFQGGIGAYSLDFSGDLRREASVEVGLGLGSVTIMLPKNVGARIDYSENWLSSHSFDNFSEPRDGEYYSYNYNDADGRINIHVTSGLGEVKVRWVDNPK